jgi:ribosomal 50S subunit-associated protein YjgA (DUF615 family)
MSWQSPADKTNKLLKDILDECKLMREEHRQRSLGTLMIIKMAKGTHVKTLHMVMEVLQNMLSTQEEVLRVLEEVRDA